MSSRGGPLRRADGQVRRLLEVIPCTLGELLNNPDPEKANRGVSVTLKMIKVEVEGLRRAYEAW